MARMPKARTFTTSWCSINSERTGPPSRCSGTGGRMRTPFPDLPNSGRKASRAEALDLTPSFAVKWLKRFCYPFGISTILPITPPLPSNSCACRAWQRGNRCAISGLIFLCCSRSNNVSRSWRNRAGFSRISHWIL
jgi:hypothetical protein